MSHHQTSPLRWTVSPHRTKSRHHRRQFMKPLSCLTASHCRARQRIHERTGRHSRLPRKRVSKHCSRPTEDITSKYSLTTQIDRNIFFGTKQKKSLKRFLTFLSPLSLHYPRPQPQLHTRWLWKLVVLFSIHVRWLCMLLQNHVVFCYYCICCDFVHCFCVNATSL